MQLFPVDNPKQTIRLKRLFMAAGSYVMWLFVGALSYRAGLLELSLQALVAYAAVIIGANLLFYAIIRSGLNLRFSDPSLTLAQCLIAVVCAAIFTWAMAEERGLAILTYFTILLFGVFQLDRRGFLLVSSLAAASYVVIVALDWKFFPDRFHLGVESLRLFGLSVLLSWSALFGLHVRSLKRRLRDKNQELEKVVEQVTTLAERDHLTRAYNRRYIMESLETEKARADRHGTPFSICIFDLDHFKTINDRFGHLAGDRILTAFAERARGELRRLDMLDRDVSCHSFGRYGGEEFLLILPSTAIHGALQCAERVRSITAGQAFDDVFNITLSAGVAEYRSGELIETTLRRADEALYSAKQNGRNQVIGEPDCDEESVELAASQP